MSKNTAPDVAALKAKHAEKVHHPDGFGGRSVSVCIGCRDRWPCDTIRVLDAYDALRRRVEELDSQLSLACTGYEQTRQERDELTDKLTAAYRDLNAALASRREQLEAAWKAGCDSAEGLESFWQRRIEARSLSDSAALDIARREYAEEERRLMAADLAILADEREGK